MDKNVVSICICMPQFVLKTFYDATYLEEDKKNYLKTGRYILSGS